MFRLTMLDLTLEQPRPDVGNAGAGTFAPVRIIRRLEGELTRGTGEVSQLERAFVVAENRLRRRNPARAGEPRRDRGRAQLGPAG